ncbi:hypothetical protein HYDPIDRAFT_34563 [Hydnomerulius pinastri MD-312]|uniref:G domain-containing protein n=1 Tax=Hydnomerulius pinastri MD-312 TaxID=994086 RepID=A0A0C9W5V1_9AGAM|nr:hypothetical protein HYDPIDRAFT_34563 [Hydnomerulius pinastri MD-312]
MTGQTSPAKHDVDVLLVGQTGVGKSTLINMICGFEEGSEGSAKVTNDVRPCTEVATSYITPLSREGKNLRYRLWDTRGLNEASDDPSIMTKAINFFCALFGVVSACERDLRAVCDEHTGRDGEKAAPLLIWCIHISKVGVPVHWEQFRKVYVDYCREKVRPVVVVTNVTPGRPSAKSQSQTELGWEERCRKQLQQLGIGFGNVPLQGVRKYRDTSTPEYKADCQAVRDFIVSHHSSN